MRILLIAGLAIGLAACANHSADLPEPSAENQAPPAPVESMPEAQDMKEKPMETATQRDFELRKLKNGLEVYAIHKSDIPMVTVLAAVKNGAFVQTPDIDGLAHLYEHMFFKANEKIPSQALFVQTLDELGVELGPNMNAYTMTESVRYFFTIQTKFLNQGLEFMADAIITPKFLPDELEKERKVVIGEFDLYEASPQQVFFQMDLLKNMFSEHYVRKNTIGSRSVILSATPEQMKGIQNRFYIPNNTALFIVGDFEDASLWPALEKYFGNWAQKPDPFEANPIPEHPPLTTSITFNKEAAVQLDNIVRAYHGPSLVLDNKGTIIFDLISLMVGLETSPFQKELIHSGLATGFYFYSWAQRFTSPLFFSVEAMPEKAQAASDKMNELIQRMCLGKFFTDEDLSLAKNAIEARSAYDRESGQNYALGLANIWTSTGSLDYYVNYVSAANAITLEEIDAYVKKYLANKPSVSGALIPTGSKQIALTKG